jgi:hypothetical protein
MTADTKELTELVIGITGHRSVEETDEVLQRIDLVLKKIIHTYPDRAWRVLSPLAEGADRVVVRRMQQSMLVELVVVLPLALDEYQKDFSTSESKQEFLQLLGQADDIVELTPSGDRDEAYAQVGQYILENCDVLVAIWNGKPERGRGGTGEIVRHARQRMLPLAWIWYQELESAEALMTPPDKDQDKIYFERFPGMTPQHE